MAGALTLDWSLRNNFPNYTQAVLSFTSPAWVARGMGLGKPLSMPPSSAALPAAAPVPGPHATQVYFRQILILENGRSFW